ncbi:YraN family protein [Cerasicoccus fimbriatus]|uniref:YraN family protein n=1 Tax=Cerasicoccus fimbriatus TaxID=3014554 RepID=UPI0022B2FF2C|nr:YraN family protein [Cerasicoccus sp. TK19100]
MLQRLRQLITPKDAPNERAARGQLGEKKAAQLLKKKGLRILHRNWRAGKDELDIIALDGATFVFVEVRSRNASAKVSGYHSVTAKKKACLLRACRAFLRQQRPRPAHFRFDIVEVRLGNDDELTIHHYENVSLFPDSFI